MAKADGSRSIAHPLYTVFQDTWQKLLEVYEGSGGFLDPERPYLIAHPREWLDHSVKQTDSDGVVRMIPNPSPVVASPKLKMRRKLARYENVAEAVLHTVTSSLFAEPPTRSVTKDNAPITDWHQDVDGQGTDIDTYLERAWIPGAVFGHTLIVMEKSSETPATAADVAQPRLCRYTPLDILDWLVDEYGQVIAVKLLEAAPREDFSPAKLTDVQVRVITDKTWTLYDNQGRKKEQADHGFGRFPGVFLYGKRRALTPVVGKSVIGDPMLFIDAYNLTSEERELLRNQTFAILNVPIGDGSVEEEQARIGSQSGTANVMFSREAAAFISPSGDNVGAYQTTQDRLHRMIYRLATVAWESDSKDAESEGSRKLKRADMQATLRRFTKEIAATDAELTELFYRATAGADGWEKAMDADGVATAYPRSFDPPDFETVLADVSAAMGLDLGETATKALKKQTVRVLLPDMTAEDREKADSEIDAMEVLTKDEKQDKLLEKAAGRMAGKPQPFGKGKEPVMVAAE